MAMVLLIPSASRSSCSGSPRDSASATGRCWCRWRCSATSLLGARAHAARPDRAADARQRQRRPAAAAADPAPRRSTWRRWPGAIADPWIALIVPAMLVGVAIGLAVGLSAAGAHRAVAAGLAFMLFVMGLTSLASSARAPAAARPPARRHRDAGAGPDHPDRRDRAAVLLPGAADRRPAADARRTAGAAAVAAPSAPRCASLPTSRRRCTTAPRRTRPAPATPPCRWPDSRLSRWAVQLAGFAAYRRVLDMPASSGDRAAPGRSAGCGTASSPASRPRRRRSRSRSCAWRCDRRAAAPRSRRRC